MLLLPELSEVYIFGRAVRCDVRSGPSVYVGVLVDCSYECGVVVSVCYTCLL